MCERERERHTGSEEEENKKVKHKPSNRKSSCRRNLLSHTVELCFLMGSAKKMTLVSVLAARSHETEGSWASLKKKSNRR